MKDLADRLAISVIESYAARLEERPPDFQKETFESLERSFMMIGKLLTDHLEKERNDDVTNG